MQGLLKTVFFLSKVQLHIEQPLRQPGRKREFFLAYSLGLAIWMQN